MFSTFIKLDDDALVDRVIIIRSEDIRRLEDTAHGTLLVFDECGGAQELLIQGSPAENLERLARDELEAMQRVQAMQQRQTNGLPIVPIPRGRGR